MIEKSFINTKGNEVYYISYPANNEKAVVVIAHGMAEHPQRYENLAYYLNNNNISVHAIYHIGHGKHAKILGHMADGEFNMCIDNINELVELVKKESQNKVFLLGHSMGSFMSQLYITKYDNIDGLILSGSTCSNGILKAGYVLSKLVCAFSKDTSRPSKFMNNLSFGSFNKQFKNAKTKFDWLNQDEAEVLKYVNDPYCGFICSQSFYKNFLRVYVDISKKENLSKINKDLPMLILGGSKDPVSNNGKGLEKLYKQYNKLNIKNVILKIYQDDRHEIYLEKNKDEVYNDTLLFLENQI